MRTNELIGFGGLFFLGVILFTLHWWLGRLERREREQDRAAKRTAP